MNWGQIRTILWLRWRLTKNQWARSGQLNVILTMIVMIFVLILGTFGGIIGMLIGILVFNQASPVQMLIIWDGFIIVFLFICMISLISEIQRSETIDIGRLIHLPISLKNAFVINYLTSYLTLGIILFVPIMIGLCIGLAFSHGLMMILLLPLILAFVFTITSWIYCLKGWLATLMVNKRRRQAVIAGITFGFIIIFQLPNLYFNFIARTERSSQQADNSSESRNQTSATDNRNEMTIPENLSLAHKIIPFLWVGNGAMALANGSIIASILGTIGCFGLGGLGISRAYRTTVRFYQGSATNRKIKKKTKRKEAVSNHTNRLAESLPYVSDETSALALAFFQNLRRAPEIKMMLGMNFFMLLFFSIMIFLRNSANISNKTIPFIIVGALTFSFTGLTRIIFNQFGFDRSGFRLLVLSPVPRKYILQGKNLSFLPVAICFGGLMILVTRLFLHITMFHFLASIMQFITAFLLISITGNLVSIYVPYKVIPGSMKLTKTTTLTTVLIIISQLSFLVFLSPILIPPVSESLLANSISLPAGMVNLILSIILLIVVFYCYRISLPPIGNLLQKREKKILEIVTREVE